MTSDLLTPNLRDSASTRASNAGSSRMDIGIAAITPLYACITMIQRADRQHNHQALSDAPSPVRRWSPDSLRSPRCDMRRRFVRCTVRWSRTRAAGREQTTDGQDVPPQSGLSRTSSDARCSPSRRIAPHRLDRRGVGNRNLRQSATAYESSFPRACRKYLNRARSFRTCRW